MANFFDPRSRYEFMLTPPATHKNIWPSVSLSMTCPAIASGKITKRPMNCRKRPNFRTMVEVVHAHVFTHKSPLGSVSDFALIDALTPKKLADPLKPSEALAE